MSGILVLAAGGEAAGGDVAATAGSVGTEVGFFKTLFFTSVL